MCMKVFSQMKIKEVLQLFIRIYSSHNRSNSSKALCPSSKLLNYSQSTYMFFNLTKYHSYNQNCYKICVKILQLINDSNSWAVNLFYSFYYFICCHPLLFQYFKREKVLKVQILFFYYFCKLLVTNKASYMLSTYRTKQLTVICWFLIFNNTYCYVSDLVHYKGFKILNVNIQISWV